MLILASNSQNRQQALTLAQIPFKAVAADIDEKDIQDIDIRVRVVKVAQAKVLAVAAHHQGLILGADGVNLVNGHIFEKPSDRNDAIRMIESQSGQTSIFLTGYYLLNTKNGESHRGTSETKYRFRVLTESEIIEYVDTEPVYNWAAAFSPLNSMAVRFVEWVEGSPTNFAFSLPLDELMPLFRKTGLVSI